MSSLASKGKWMPGSREIRLGLGKNYPCDVCDREFSKKIYLDKHLTTELHFKRSTQKLTLTEEHRADDLDLFFDQHNNYNAYGPRRSTRENKGRPNGSRQSDNLSTKPQFANPDLESLGSSSGNSANNGTSPTSSSTHTHTRCTTCFSTVVKKQMGKHLISHFHCQFQKTKSSRLMTPEINLILEHIHDIVVQSPYQCGSCKFYFTQKEQLIAHISQYHVHQSDNLQVDKEIPSSVGWNCLACCRTQFIPNGEALLEHLNSSGHKIMESAIAKSIPIIVRQVTLQRCPQPNCDKMFILNRELLSHINLCHDKELSSLVNGYYKYESTDSKNYDRQSHDTPCTTDTDTDTTTEFSKNIKRKTQTVTAMQAKKKKQAVRKMSISTAEAGGLKFKQRESIIKHLTTEIDDTLECQMLVQSDHQYYSRKSPRNGKERIQHSCGLCNYSTHRKNHYTRHQKIHDETPRTKEFKCTECSSSFGEKYALKFHTKIHEGKTVKCWFPSCNYVGRSNSEIRSHFVMHNSPDLYPCDKCKYSTKSKPHLTRHQLLVHHDSFEKRSMNLLEKRFKCLECQFETNIANGLKRHLLQHTGESPYHCPFCDLKTKNIENLRLHVIKRKVHPGKHLYTCRICLKANMNIAKPNSIYKTNTFLDFRKHVTQQHSDHPHSKSQTGIFIIAGVQKPKNEALNDLPSIPRDESTMKTSDDSIPEPTTNLRISKLLKTSLSTSKELEKIVKDSFTTVSHEDSEFNLCESTSLVAESTDNTLQPNFLFYNDTELIMDCF